MAKKIERKTSNDYAIGTKLTWAEFNSLPGQMFKLLKECGCGCGAIVERNFAQGHDMKLKSQELAAEAANTKKKGKSK